MTSLDDLPILSPTRPEWAPLAARRLDEFLADHAVCEQQAAQSALSMVGLYPTDEELVERMTALAAEEIAHLRKVAALLRKRGANIARRRPNGYVRALRAAVDSSGEPDLLADRLFVCALIEARSCERFTLLREAVDDADVRSLLDELGPAEARHWRIFHELAERQLTPARFDERWKWWLEIEREQADLRGVAPTVHG